MQLRTRGSAEALRERLLNRAHSLSATRALEDIAYDEFRGSDELKVFWKFLKWQRKEGGHG